MSKPFSLPDSVCKLPIRSVLDEVVQALEHSNVLLEADPGAGKSTGLPLALLQSATPTRKIVMLEPRRLAAQSVALRLAEHLSEPLGQRVGLRMRADTRVSDKTVIEVVTEGVLTRILQADPELTGYSVVIFDEFHERSLHADLGLALCLEVQNVFRSDLRLMFMSATLSTNELAQHLELHRHSDLQPLQRIHAAGRQFPVNIEWAGHGASTSMGSDWRELPGRVIGVIGDALQQHTGDILVFLPGVAEIDRTARRLNQDLSNHESVLARQARGESLVHVHCLHSRVDRKSQQKATAKSSASVRRIILSTSLAETSITIEGVRVVIDTGLERRGRFDNRTGVMRLETVSASQASATQRAGRAGRTAPGVCYRLWSEVDHARRVVGWEAEIHRSDFSQALLELALWGVSDVHALPWLEEPSSASVDRARQLLNDLGVLNEERISPLGEIVATLPTDPRLGAMLVWASQRNAVEAAESNETTERNKTTENACQLAALLEEGGSSGEMDVVSMLSRPLSATVKRRARQLQKQLELINSNVRRLDESNASGVADQSALRRTTQLTPSISIFIAKAYPDWIASRRRGRDARYQLACGAGVVMTDEATLAHEPWLAVASMGGAGKEARVFQAAALDITELKTHAPDLLIDRRVCEWDESLERVVAEQQTLLGSIVVDAKQITDISDEDKQLGLLSGIRRKGLACLPWTDKCRQWQARVQLARSLSASHAISQWPSVDDATLFDTLEDWLPVWLNGLSSLKAVSQLDLHTILHSLLDYRQQQELDRLLPIRFQVPSGSNIALRYAEGEVVLAVKLQEMFGCTTNPSIADGAIVLKIELLSPARRPVQITSDLANFWVNSYPAVKKDLAGRYPKHPWPDDPLSAAPSAKAKPRKRR